ncbi:Uncharacterised protein [Bordetella pertussis]|nr:Uncharacterised protein [Bordetella pertussis]
MVTSTVARRTWAAAPCMISSWCRCLRCCLIWGSPSISLYSCFTSSLLIRKPLRYW